jgi:hypothetical protein
VRVTKDRPFINEYQIYIQRRFSLSYNNIYIIAFSPEMDHNNTIMQEQFEILWDLKVIHIKAHFF